MGSIFVTHLHYRTIKLLLGNEPIIEHIFCILECTVYNERLVNIQAIPKKIYGMPQMKLFSSEFSADLVLTTVSRVCWFSGGCVPYVHPDPSASINNNGQIANACFSRQTILQLSGALPCRFVHRNRGDCLKHIESLMTRSYHTILCTYPEHRKECLKHENVLLRAFSTRTQQRARNGLVRTAWPWGNQ